MRNPSKTTVEEKTKIASGLFTWDAPTCEIEIKVWMNTVTAAKVHGYCFRGWEPETAFRSPTENPVNRKLEFPFNQRHPCSWEGNGEVVHIERIMDTIRKNLRLLAYGTLKKLRSMSTSQLSVILTADGCLVSDVDGQMASWAEYFEHLCAIHPLMRRHALNR